MAKLVEIEFTKTYATRANAQKAVEKAGFHDVPELRYMIMPVVGETVRYGVLFIGIKACDHGVHFHFNVVN